MSETPVSIFKIFRPDEWEALCRDGETQGSPLDVTDGYIHFSTQTQTAETLRLHFRGAGTLILAETPIKAVSDREIRWEAARDGSLFAHLYGCLRRTDVTRHWTLHPDGEDRYALPERFGD